jgi:hypothetical protein
MAVHSRLRIILLARPPPPPPPSPCDVVIQRLRGLTHGARARQATAHQGIQLGPQKRGAKLPGAASHFRSRTTNLGCTRQRTGPIPCHICCNHRHLYAKHHQGICLRSCAGASLSTLHSGSPSERTPTILETRIPPQDFQRKPQSQATECECGLSVCCGCGYFDRVLCSSNPFFLLSKCDNQRIRARCTVRTFPIQ